MFWEKFRLTDKNPLHLSLRPLLVFGLGVVNFGTAAFSVVMYDPTVERIVFLIIGVGLMAAGYRGAVRERSDFQGAISDQERAAEKKIDEAGA